MSNNETRVSNERLADLLTAETMLVVTVEEFRYILTEIQDLRSTPVEAEPLGYVSRKEIGLLREWAGGDYVAGVSRRSTKRRDVPVYPSNPLPNPSPSDGEVSEALEQAANIARCAFDDRPRRDNLDWNDGFDDGTKAAAEAIRAALQSKRGQP